MIDINKYADFFHDGSIIDIDPIDKRMIIVMESAEVDKEDIKDDITLSNDARIRGILYTQSDSRIGI